jgi:hypothetical protein
MNNSERTRNEPGTRFPRGLAPKEQVHLGGGVDASSSSSLRERAATLTTSLHGSVAPLIVAGFVAPRSSQQQEEVPHFPIVSSMIKNRRHQLSYSRSADPHLPHHLDTSDRSIVATVVPGVPGGLDNVLYRDIASDPSSRQTSLLFLLSHPSTMACLPLETRWKILETMQNERRKEQEISALVFFWRER